MTRSFPGSAPRLPALPLIDVTAGLYSLAYQSPCSLSSRCLAHSHHCPPRMSSPPQRIHTLSFLLAILPLVTRYSAFFFPA
ncbi:hypothetical protein BCV70DRAFT_125741 [Testicularia cyperi]|uniref:Uncharacterized protein n=1 Tax=Testicularia cyperi TaxID=1882483 RepID=A0A317XP42_9BASI|nr:hypothetical protein BCV70DRAFT_125741 [Testicularia cyperi]